MKKYIFTLMIALIVAGTINAQSDSGNTSDIQTQDFNDPFSYRVLGLVYVYKFDADTRTPENTLRIASPNLLFNIVGEETDSSDNSKIYIVQFPPIQDNTITSATGAKTLKGDPVFINSDHNQDYHWLKKEDLVTYLEDGFVRKSFKKGKPSLTYGGHVTLPFKLRPSIDTFNIKIQNDINLGGYIGAKWRISQYQPFFLSFPIVTLGLSTLQFGDNTTPGGTAVGDGKVLGITGSWGGIFQLNTFQFGFLMGWDRAAGQIGKDWIYNNQPWYSFSVGYTFIGDSTSKNAPKN